MEAGSLTMRTASLIAACLLALAACNQEKERLTVHLASLEERRAAVARRVTERANAIAETERNLATLTAELTAHNTGVHAFLASHQGAATCIRTSRSTWGGDSPYVNEVSALSRFGTALCSVLLLDGDFAREVEHVTSTLREADARAKALKEQIAAAQRKLETDRAELRRDQDAVEGIAAELADVRWQLDGR
jgi:septal ring factor EnvC (AmiA/AmiB activator)